MVLHFTSVLITKPEEHCNPKSTIWQHSCPRWRCRFVFFWSERPYDIAEGIALVPIFPKVAGGGGCPQGFGGKWAVFPAMNVAELFSWCCVRMCYKCGIICKVRSQSCILMSLKALKESISINKRRSQDVALALGHCNQCS